MKSVVKKLISSSYFRGGIAVAISIISLYLALRDVSLQEVWHALSLADIKFVALALLSVGINTFGKTIRWKVLMGNRGREILISQTFSALLVGQMLNTIYPARIGDLSRAYTIGGYGPGRVFVLGTVVIEKVLDMLSYALLFLFLLFLVPLPTWVSESGYTFAGLALAISIATFIITFKREWVIRSGRAIIAYFPERIKTFAGNKFLSALASLDVLQNRQDLVKLAFWSALIWGTAVLNNHLTLLALGIHLPLTASLLILIALQAGITIPSVPGRFGVFEYICVLSLGIFGIGQTTGFTYGILLHGIVMLPTTLLGLIFFSFSGASGGVKDLESLSAEMPTSEQISEK